MTQFTIFGGLDQRSIRQSVRAAILALSALTGCVHLGAKSSTGEDVRVLVYNVHAGKDAAGKESVQRIANVVKSVDPDIVLFQ